MVDSHLVESVLARLDYIEQLTKQLARARDVVERHELAERIQREFAIARHGLVAITGSTVTL